MRPLAAHMRIFGDMRDFRAATIFVASFHFEIIFEMWAVKFNSESTRIPKILSVFWSGQWESKSKYIGDPNKESSPLAKRREAAVIKNLKKSSSY